MIGLPGAGGRRLEPSPESLEPITQPLRKCPETAGCPTNRVDSLPAETVQPVAENGTETLAIRKLRPGSEMQPATLELADEIRWPATSVEQLFAKRSTEPAPPPALNELDSKRPRPRPSEFRHADTLALAEALPAPASSDGLTATAPCPKCQKPVTLSAGLGYCSACGYCGTFDGGQPSDHAHPSRTLLRPVEAVFMVLPPWVWVMVGGIVAITLVSLTAEKTLLSPQLRAYWAASQLVLGVVCFWIAQGWMFLKLAPDDTGADWRDIFIVSGRLWKGAVQRLPESCWPIWLGGWGIWMSLSAFLFVGGTGQWLSWLGWTTS
jgi:hypothetical protein